jgi:hypothetical protein
MLRQWLAPESVESFLATHLHAQPFARPDAARDTVARFQWETLAKVQNRCAMPRHSACSHP